MNFLSRSLAISVIVFFPHSPLNGWETFWGFEAISFALANGMRGERSNNCFRCPFNLLLQPQKSFNAWKIQQDLRWFFTEQDDVFMNKLRTASAVAVHKKEDYYYRNFRNVSSDNVLTHFTSSLRNVSPAMKYSTAHFSLTWKIYNHSKYDTIIFSPFKFDHWMLAEQTKGERITMNKMHA